MDKIAMNIYEFSKRFPDERSARLYIEAHRWRGEPVCPHCNSERTMHKQTRNEVDGYYRCPDCRKVFTVRTGTVFERSHVPLSKWVYAICLVTESRKYISSLQLSKEVGVTQKTAWLMLERLREGYRPNNPSDSGKIVFPQESSRLLKHILAAEKLARTSTGN